MDLDDLVAIRQYWVHTLVPVSWLTCFLLTVDKNILSEGSGRGDIFLFVCLLLWVFLGGIVW